jgi:glycosyltransferase involved in cell wall biosynthesis
MKVSVIIPTYNGAAKLPALLQALLAQTFTDFELVVVVDGSTDNTMEVLNAYVPRFRQMKIIVQKNRGRAAVKNRGIQESSGTILIFMDDDMLPQLDCVEKHVHFHLGNEGVLGGHIMETEQSPFADFQKYKGALSVKWLAKYPLGRTRLSMETIFFSSANSSFTRSVANTLKGFDEHLTDAEDYDFAYRALESDIPVFFDKRIVSIHREVLSTAQYVRRLRQYSIAHAILRNKYPERSKVIPRQNKLKKLIYFPFSFSFWMRLIDNGSLLFLPALLRYKIYDMVIQAWSVEFTYRKI